MKRPMKRLAAAAGLFVFLAACLASAGRAGSLPEGFVHLASVAPGIAQDIRYASAANFTGAPVPGYASPSCILAVPVAEALARVQSDLKPSGLTLLVFDCYRPARAVRHFVEWAATGGEARDPAYHPNVRRSRLVAEGYIAARSGHSSGGSVDLTLARILPGGGHEALDMGGAFDLFDRRSHVDAPDIPVAARANRALLARAMAREGFAGYRREWWHFRYRDEPFPGKSFDFPVSSPD
jgi:zinc D-Ala-D-Ala dipeptidase